MFGPREYIAVVSLDGLLSVFEQDSHAFTRFLPGFLIPGPIVYVERNDREVSNKTIRNK